MITTHTITERGERRTSNEAAVRYLLERQVAVARMAASGSAKQRRIGVTRMDCERAIGATLADLQHEINQLTGGRS